MDTRNPVLIGGFLLTVVIFTVSLEKKWDMGLVMIFEIMMISVILYSVYEVGPYYRQKVQKSVAESVLQESGADNAFLADGSSLLQIKERSVGQKDFVLADVISELTIEHSGSNVEQIELPFIFELGGEEYSHSLVLTMDAERVLDLGLLDDASGEVIPLTPDSVVAGGLV